MNAERVKEIIGEHITEDGGLFCLGHYIAWTPGDSEVTLDSKFTADELEAIAWWMRANAQFEASLAKS